MHNNALNVQTRYRSSVVSACRYPQQQIKININKPYYKAKNYKENNRLASPAKGGKAAFLVKFGTFMAPNQKMIKQAFILIEHFNRYDCR